MKVLVATAEGQGTRAGDFCWTLEGELVLAGALLECSEAGTCGCGRGFPGLGSARATTTAMVADRPGLEAGDLRQAIRDSLDRQGWFEGLSPADADDLVDEQADLVERVAGAFAVGAVLARDDGLVWRRREVAA